MARRRETTPKSDVRTVILFSLRSMLRCILYYLSYLRYLDPFYVVSQRQKTLYYVDAHGNVLCKPPFFQRVVDLFQTDAASRRKLLDWAQDKVPCVRLDNFNSAWHDGIALCSLIDAVFAGACPRHDLLKPHHRVNNCRLGLKLAQKHLQVPQGIITPEEMAIADANTEPKIRQLITMIKWSSKKKKNHPDDAVLHTKQKYIPSSDSIDRVTKRCIAKGNGIMVGLVGKRCKFYIHTEAHGLLDLHIEIKGPNNEICSEKIMSLFPTRRMSRLLNVEDVTKVSSKKLRLRDSDGDTKYLEDDDGNTYIRQKSVDVDDVKNYGKIPFDYQCVGEGKYQVSYVPRSSGKHILNIYWQGHNITGSPFTVDIADSADALERQFSKSDKRRGFLKKSMDSTDPFSSTEKDTNNRSETTNISSRHVPFPNPKADSPYRGHTSGSSSSNKMTKQGTVTRRRVLKRIVTKDGKEIILHETAPSPVLSRQSSYSHSPILSQQSSIDLARISDEAEDEMSLYSTTSGRGRLESAGKDLVENIDATSKTKTEETGDDPLPQFLDTSNASSDGDMSFIFSLNSDTEYQPAESFADKIVDTVMKSAYESMNKKIYTRQKCIELADSVVMHESAAEENSTKETTLHETASVAGVAVDHGDETDNLSNDTGSREPKIRDDPMIITYDSSNVRLDNSDTVPVVSQSLATTNTRKLDPENDTDSFIGKAGGRLCRSNSGHSVDLKESDWSSRSAETRPVKNIVKQVSCVSKTPPDTLSLKLLQSESLHKVCYYISQKAFSRSVPSLQSQTSAGKVYDVSIDLDNATPGFKANYSVNSHEPVSHVTRQEICPTNAMPSSICELTKTSELSGGITSSAGVKVNSSTVNSNQLLVVDLDNLGGQDSTNASLTSAAVRSGRRGSLVRQEMTVLQKLSEESSGESDKFSKSVKGQNSASGSEHADGVSKVLDDITSLPGSCPSTSDDEVKKQSSSDIGQDDEGFNSITDISNVISTSPAWFSSQIQIRIPTPKIDKWTQVSYGDIKNETGWLSPAACLRHRKLYRLLQNSTGSGSPDPSEGARGNNSSICKGPSTGPNHGVSDSEPRSPLSVWYGDNLPQIVCDHSDVVDNPEVKSNGGHVGNGHYNVQQWLRNNRVEMAGLHPVRQSTIETVDSGIAESRCSSPARLAARRHRNSLPNPNILNGHRPVCRRPYQGEIELDPRLLRSASNSPSGDDEKENCFPARPRNLPALDVNNDEARGHRQVWRNNSDCPRARRRAPSREDSCSLSDTELNSRTPPFAVENRKALQKAKLSKRFSGRAVKANQRRHEGPVKEPSFTVEPKDAGDRPDSSQRATVPGSAELSASHSRKIKLRRRSFALMNSQTSRRSVDTSAEESTLLRNGPSCGISSKIPAGSGTDEVIEHVEPVSDSRGRRKSFGGMPTTTKRELHMQRSSTQTDDYCGFGISRDHRDDLLTEVDVFRNLYEKHDADDPRNGTDIKEHVELTAGDGVQQPWKQESTSDIPQTSESDGFTQSSSQKSGILSDLCQVSNVRNGTTCSRTPGDLEAMNDFYPGYRAFDQSDDLFDIVQRMANQTNIEDDDDIDDLEIDELREPGFCNPTRCHAFGAGLQIGQIGTKNNFQVSTDGAGSGIMTVGINGPRPNSVTETSITYTGDNLYEVIYDVTQPGYYVINIKWSDQSVPNSPYIAKVTL